MIADFRNHQRQEQASMLFDRDRHSRRKVVAATFKDETDIKSNKNPEKNNEKFNQKEYLCGNIHA